MYLSWSFRGQSHYQTLVTLTKTGGKQEVRAVDCREVGLRSVRPGFEVQMMICTGLLGRRSGRDDQLTLGWEVHQLAAL